MDLGSPAVHDNKYSLTSGDEAKNLVNKMNLNFPVSPKPEENNDVPCLWMSPGIWTWMTVLNSRKVVCSLKATGHSLPIQCFSKILLNSNNDAETLDNHKIEKIDSKRAETNSGGNVAKGTQNCGNMLSVQNRKGSVDHALVTYPLKFGDLENLLSTMASKETVLSQAALRVLLNKKDKLIFQLQDIEDEIAHCDKKMHTILNGGEGGLSLIIEGCNEGCLKNICEPRASQKS